MRNKTIAIISSIVVCISLTNCKKQTAAINDGPNNTLSAIKTSTTKWNQLQLTLKGKNLSKAKKSEAITQSVLYTKLCMGENYSGEATPNSIENASQFSYYYFEGKAGDVVTIQVSRTGNCAMDPALSLYYGTTNDLTNVNYVGGGPNMTFLAFADDDILPICNNICFADPLLSNYELPYTGKYTVAVYDFINCGPGPLTFDIAITGIAPCIIAINGCNTGISNKLLPSGNFMMDEILALAVKAKNHGQFVSQVSRLTNTWHRAGLITGAEKGKIMSCAGSSKPGK